MNPSLATGLLASFHLAASALALSDPVVKDIFGRRLNEREITLVDWEGQMANPAIQLLPMSRSKRFKAGSLLKFGYFGLTLGRLHPHN